MECAGCGAELTGRQRKWCSTECCRQNAYAQQLKKAVPDRFCRHCNKQLAGRQSVWCSLACKRDHETELALVDGIETHVRKCKTCGLMKPLAVDFYKTANGRYRRDCRACVMASNDNRNANPDAADKARNYHLKSLYDITADEYEEILAAQGGRCAVCGKPPIKQRLAVDHDHRTGLVRGLLCSYCNLRIIGKQTNVELLRKATDYLDNPPAYKVIGERTVPKNRPKKKRKPRRRK
jgi:hypothetical protein